MTLRLTLRIVACAAWLGALALAPARAHADAREQRARVHFEVGHGAYRVGHYDEAIREFLAGYGLSPKPAFLLNIGQAYRALGDNVHALEYYRRFLADAGPAEPNRAQAERICGELERAIADEARAHEQARRAEPPPAPPPPPIVLAQPVVRAPPAPRSGAAKAVGGTLLGIGIGALGAGGGLLGGAAAANDALDHPAPGTVYDPSVLQRRDTFVAGGIALLAIGGAATVTGIVVLAVGRRASPARASAGSRAHAF